jgi:uncharacterized membrane protein YhiD involved in acid resistance
VAAGIGMSIGFGLWELSLVTALFTLAIFSFLWKVEKLIAPTQVLPPAGRRPRRTKSAASSK